MFSVQIDPKSSSLAVSGGEDDKAYVWHTASGQLAFECPGKLDTSFKARVLMVDISPTKR